MIYFDCEKKTFEPTVIRLVYKKYDKKFYFPALIENPLIIIFYKKNRKDDVI